MKRKNGFSLIEIIMVILILGIAASTIAVLFFGAVNAHNQTQTRIDAIEQGRIALRRIVREIRLLDQREIYSATLNQFSFRNVFGATNTFNTSGTDLLMNNRPLVRNVSNFTLTYYDRNNNILTPAPAGSIYLILIRLNITDRAQTVYLRSQIFPRDFK